MNRRLNAILCTAIAIATVTCLLTIPDATWSSPLSGRHATAQAGPVRGIFRWIFRRRHVEPLPPEPTPEPTPDPVPPVPPIPPIDSASIVAVWDTIAMPNAWTATARSHDLADWLTARGVTWTQLDPITAGQVPPPPPWAQSIFAAALRHNLKPPYLLVLRPGQPTRPHQLTIADTQKTVKEKIADDLPKTNTTQAALPFRRGTGLLKRTAPYGTLKAAGRPILSLADKLKPLPESEYPTCDLRTSIPFIDDQRTSALCTSFAATLLTETARYVQFGPSNAKRISAASVANQIDGWSGAALTDAITAIANTGCLPESVCPELSRQMPSGWRTTAAGFRWSRWYDAPAADPLGYTCAALARGYVAIVGIGVGSGFEPDSRNFISYTKGSGNSGHAVVVCGHDNHATPKRSLIANSWGADWGDHGFAWIDDQFISRTQYDGPYVCTAVTIAADDTGPTIAPATPASAPPAALDCPSGTCPILPSPILRSLAK